MTTPVQLKDESPRAYDAFKAYCADPKRSIRRCARKLRKSPTIIARFSKKYRWQKRLRELALEDCQRSVAADEAAKLNVAEERERERTAFQQRALEASKRATQRALEILKESAKGSKPSDAARLLAVGDAIGRAALGLAGAESPRFAFGVQAVTPVINVITRRDEQSDYADALERRYLREHPEHPQARLRADELREHEASDSEILERIGANDSTV